MPVGRGGGPHPSCLASSLRRRSQAAMEWARRRTDRVRSRAAVRVARPAALIFRLSFASLATTLGQ